jgi:transcriptional regulator with XRE-family HTH domain
MTDPAMGAPSWFAIVRSDESRERGLPHGNGDWYLIGYHDRVDADRLLAAARHRAHLTLRALARLAGTSHSTLAAYEGGSKEPAVATLDRIVRAAGLVADVSLRGRVTDRRRGAELAEALHLAAQFPARHGAALTYPPFPRR